MKSFMFFLAQAVAQCFFAYPFAVLATSGSRLVLWTFWLGALLSLTGLLGESIADKQLKSYVADAANRGMVCNLGLWRYSRHPNYFFEWIVWCGFGTMGAAAPGGWPSIVCPCAMLGLLLFVTGAPPPAEASSLRSKGQRYRDYQDRTSQFVPWFPKASHRRSKEAS